MSWDYGVDDPIKSLEFQVFGLPKAQGRPRAVKIAGFARVIDDPESNRAKENFRAQAIAHRPNVPFAGALALEIGFVFPIPVSWPAWQQEAARAGKLLHTSRPDTDNLTKLVLDALNAIFWADDAQIVSIAAGKAYGPAALTKVLVRRLNEPRDAKDWKTWKHALDIRVQSAQEAARA